ncbi:MAG: hypothetical protein WCJ30_08065 [Deltaproteobacteria bacterium]
MIRRMSWFWLVPIALAAACDGSRQSEADAMTDVAMADAADAADVADVADVADAAEEVSSRRR